MSVFVMRETTRVPLLAQNDERSGVSSHTTAGVHADAVSHLARLDRAYQPCSCTLGRLIFGPYDLSLLSTFVALRANLETAVVSDAEDHVKNTLQRDLTA